MPTTTPQQTRRERIMVEVKRRLEQVESGLPAADPFLSTFEAITRGAPLEGIHLTAGRALAIIDTEERKTAKINRMNCALIVVVEFLGWVDDGREPSSVGNEILGDLQRKMREDLHLTEPDDGRALNLRQLSNNVVEQGSQLFIDGLQDTKISGAVTFQINYTHGINDPRELVSAL